jgi:prepilin-type N-terminal cleavage/methylation domain-containing protein
MKRVVPRTGFTLIEMVIVIAIILLLAGLVIGIANYAMRKAAKERVLTEIKSISGAIEAYRIDNGTVPQNSDTDLLDARIHFDAVGGSSGDYYRKASLYLYQTLSGDLEPANAPDGKPETGNRSYYTFERCLNVARTPTGEITRVNFVQDPFGSSYGYSTAGLKLETEYRKELRSNQQAPRPADRKGFNATNFDLWSTTGATTQDGQAKWVKNWGG